MAQLQDQAHASNIEAAIRESMAHERADINTMLPGIIRSFDKATQRATVQLTLRRKVAINVERLNESELSGLSEDERAERQGNWAIPELLDVPVCYPRAGGFAFTFPVKAGDECLVIFAARNIDNWLESGAVSNIADARMHALADGVAIVGGFSDAAAMDDYADDRVALREVDGAGAIEIFESGKFRITNGTDEVLDLISQTQKALSDFMDEVAGLKAVIPSGSSAGNHAHDKIGAINSLKSGVDDLKAKMDGLTG